MSTKLKPGRNLFWRDDHYWEQGYPGSLRNAKGEPPEYPVNMWWLGGTTLLEYKENNNNNERTKGLGSSPPQSEGVR